MLKRARRIAVLSTIALVASLSALAQTSTWNIDPAHSTAQFTVRHLGISNVTGSFTKVTGTVVLNDRDIALSEVSATIDANSVDTRGNLRRGISAATTINRKDFNLLYNDLLKTGEAVVGDTVKIQIDAEMVKKK